MEHAQPALLAAAVDDAPIIVLEFGRDETVTHASGGGLAVLGIEAHGIVGTSGRDQTDRCESWLNALVHHALHGEGFHRGEVHVCWRTVRDDHGRLLGSVGRVKVAGGEATRPVGRRCPSEEAATWFADIVHAADALIIAVDLDNVVLSWNRGAERILGYTAAEMVGRSTAAFFAPGEFEKIRVVTDRVARGEHVVVSDHLALRKDGRPVSLSATIAPVYGPAGTVVGQAVVTRDETELRAREAERARAAAHSAAIADLARAIADASLDVPTVCESVARALASNIGDACIIRLAHADGVSLVPIAFHHHDPAAAARISVFVPEPNPDGLDALLAEVRQTGRTAYLRDVGDLGKLWRSGGGSAIVAAIRTVSGPVMGTISVLRDLGTPPLEPEDIALVEECARRAAVAMEHARLFEAARDEKRRAARANVRLRRSRALLQQRVEERTRDLTALLEEVEAMTYTMSHELRQPLRTIDGFTAMLADDHGAALGDEGQAVLARIRAAAARMARLVDRLLDVARLAHPELDLQIIDLSAMAEDLALDFGRRDPDRRVVWAIQPDVRCRADRTLLRVVLTQLLDNAWKFTAPHEAAHITFGTATDGDTTRYFVRDDGVGFEMAYAEQLFRPLRQLHPLTLADGSGIGLAAVRRIVGRIGGRVWAEGRPGAGATFSFTLE